MLTLKKYQQDTLNVLRNFLEEARFGNPQAVFENHRSEAAKRAAPLPYRPLPELGETPYICLRLPTGGGKTLLSAYCISKAAQAYLEQDFPLVLWLVPTNTIRKQTLETLKDLRHANRESLTQQFGSQVLVLDIADFTQIRPHDIKNKTVVVVGTMQTLRVDNTEGRKVYAHHEDLEPHFVNVPKTLDGLEKIEEGAGKGTIRFSFRNLLALHRPLVIVDEAHNATSKLSVEVMQRIRPACIVEFTATPAENSNILHSVSASELKAEDMIKLPILLKEHQTWEEALTAAVLTRNKLAEIAKQEKRDYIRPIVLFQAEDKGHEITHEVILKYLTDQENIPREKIAIATGSQRELDDVDLLDKNCKIEYVITVEALKEGWDCSFAYVFCSVARVHSKKDIEQIFGRVLRMPYAKKRVQDELNRAYAHVSQDTWRNAVSELQDSMVSMGFEEQEARRAIATQLPFPTEVTDPAQQSLFTPDTRLVLSAMPDLSRFTSDQLTQITTRETVSGEIEVHVSGNIDSALADTLVQSAPRQDRAAVKNIIAVQQAQQVRTPSQRGERFVVPQLCMFVDGEWEVASKSWFLDYRDWNLLDNPAELTEAEFAIREEANAWLIDVKDKHLSTQYLGSETLFDLSDASTSWTLNQLSRDLEKKIRPAYVRQEVLLEFIRRTLQHLTDMRRIPFTDLVRARFILEKVLRDKVADYYQQAIAKGYSARLFGPEAAVETSYDYAFEFPTDPFLYPARWHYSGRYVWNKHYYPNVGELDNEGEEFECAQALDRNSNVKYWVRNISRGEKSFKLPTSTDYFYPDFVAYLNDGRVLVVEYKGAHIATTDDTKEKANVGELWQSKSPKHDLFLMTFDLDSYGRDVYKQIEDKIRGS